MMFSIFSFCFHLLSLSLLLNSLLVQSLTSRDDVAALNTMLRSIDPVSIPNNSYLSTWRFSFDPCESSGDQFMGIFCTFPSDNSSSRVVEITLDGVGYDGFLTPEIEALTELTTIDLRDNKLRGPIPATITSLGNLRRLLLSGNLLTGMIPRGIRAMTRLQVLDLSRNQLSGAISPELTRLHNLKQLLLANNGFYGRIPNLRELWKLNTLDLSGNQLWGALPSLPTRVMVLRLSRNMLSGEVSRLASIMHLRTLDLSDNRFTGIIDNDILTLPEILTVNVSGNRFVGLRIGKLFEDPELQVLDAQDNDLQGQLPVNLVAMEKLTSINLARNKLSGPVPAEYGSKVGKQWKNLFLDHNYLTGNVPPELNNGTALEFMGSLAVNCLACPATSPLCSGGQRPTSQCSCPT